jgi:hypothetical protein
MQELEEYDQQCEQNEEAEIQGFNMEEIQHQVKHENSNGFLLTTQSMNNDKLNNALVDIKDSSINDSCNVTLNMSLGKKFSLNPNYSETDPKSNFLFKIVENNINTYNSFKKKSIEKLEKLFDTSFNNDYQSKTVSKINENNFFTQGTYDQTDLMDDNN